VSAKHLIADVIDFVIAGDEAFGIKHNPPSAILA
jgi:hypothetical protein